MFLILQHVRSRHKSTDGFQGITICMLVLYNKIINKRRLLIIVRNLQDNYKITNIAQYMHSSLRNGQNNQRF